MKTVRWNSCRKISIKCDSRCRNFLRCCIKEYCAHGRKFFVIECDFHVKVKIPFVATSWITESICANSLADAKVHELLAVDFSGISLKASQELAKEAAEASSTKKRKKDQSSDKVSPKQDEAQLDPVVAHNLKQVPKCYHKKPASLRKVVSE